MATQPIHAATLGRINIPDGPFLDARGNISPAWRIWLLNPNVQSIDTAAPVTAYNGGTGTQAVPTANQLPYGDGTGAYAPTAFTALPIFTSTTPGIAPASGGGAKNFLRADAVYASPVAGSAGQVQFNSSSAFAASSTMTTDGAGLLTLKAIAGNTATTTIDAASAGLLNLRAGNTSTAISITNSGATTQIGLYGTPPVGQAAAYTLTYSTAARTVPAATATTVATTAATLIAYGYTQAQADSIPVAINALEADVLALKKVIVALINDSSMSLGIGLNAT